MDVPLYRELTSPSPITAKPRRPGSAICRDGYSRMTCLRVITARLQCCSLSRHLGAFRWGGLQPQCHLVFPFPDNWTNSGAYALLRGRPPASRSRGRLILHAWAGRGRPARTRGSAPPIDSESRPCEKYAALGFSRPQRGPQTSVRLPRASDDLREVGLKPAAD